MNTQWLQGTVKNVANILKAVDSGGRKMAQATRDVVSGAREKLSEMFAQGDLPEGFRLLRPQDTAADMVLQRQRGLFDPDYGMSPPPFGRMMSQGVGVASRGMMGGYFGGMVGGPPGAMAGAAAGVFAEYLRNSRPEQIRQIMRGGNVSRDVAEYTLRVQKYMKRYGVSWEEAKEKVAGGRFDVGRTREIEDLREDERAVMRDERRAQRDMPAGRPEGMPAMGSAGPDPADWRTTSMMGLELSSLGIKETEALAYAHELYKHPELRGYMDEMIGSRIPSMKDIQEVYEAMAETPFRDYLINVQDKMVRRFGEDVILLDTGRIETLEPRLVRGSGKSGGPSSSAGPSGGVFRPRVVV